ncbi:hypothetical protein [Nocardia vinacea]|nr:hypothetical protein [Nocardia vinacea]
MSTTPLHGSAAPGLHRPNAVVSARATAATATPIQAHHAHRSAALVLHNM